MKTGNCALFYEIEPDHVNFTKLLDISKELDYDKDYPLELELNVVYNYHYDKGRIYGAPENCYPPEFDFEVNEVYLEGIEISNLLTDKDFQYIDENAQLEIEL